MVNFEKVDENHNLATFNGSTHICFLLDNTTTNNLLTLSIILFFDVLVHMNQS